MRKHPRIPTLIISAIYAIIIFLSNFPESDSQGYRSDPELSDPEFQSCSMSDPTLSDIDFKNKMASLLWTRDTIPTESNLFENFSGNYT